MDCLDTFWQNASSIVLDPTFPGYFQQSQALSASRSPLAHLAL